MDKTSFKAQHIRYIGHAIIKGKTEAYAIYRELIKYKDCVIYVDECDNETFAIRVIKRKPRFMLWLKNKTIGKQKERNNENVIKFFNG